MITLYHGSNVKINDIDLSQCNPYKDFGQAFYLTTEQNQAMEMALAKVDIFGGELVINAYSFNEKLLADGSSKYLTDILRSGLTLYTCTETRRMCHRICIHTMWCMDR